MTNFIEILQFSCSAAVFALYREAKLVCKGNDTLESFLSKVAVKSDLRKKTCKNRTCSNRESLFRKNNCSAVAEMGNCLATTDMGQKLGGGCVPFGGSWIPT